MNINVGGDKPQQITCQPFKILRARYVSVHNESGTSVPCPITGVGRSTNKSFNVMMAKRQSALSNIHSNRSMPHDVQITCLMIVGGPDCEPLADGGNILAVLTGEGGGSRAAAAADLLLDKGGGVVISSRCPFTNCCKSFA